MSQICEQRFCAKFPNVFLFYSANTLIDLGKNLENPSDYALAVDSQLGDFAFPDDFIFDIWGAINDAKAGRI